MKTTVTELPNSRARVDVEVPPDDVDRHLNRAARGLAREMRMPGFRKGKAPPGLVIQRLGRGAVLEQALRDSLPEWYERALLDSGVSPVGDPSIEVTAAPESEGEALEFKFEIAVRPGAGLGDYKGLEVGRAEPDVPDDIIDREVERIRGGMARLEPVDRAAADGDVLLVDFSGSIDGEEFEGGSANDYLLELGSSQLIEGFEEQLRGVSGGDEREVEVTFPEDYGAEHLAGRDAVFAVTVKEVREKILPDLDDDFASEASEFDTLEELRADIREKLGEAVGQRIEQDFRVAAIDAAVDKATVELPDDVVAARAEERWSRVERQLTGRGMDPNMYLQMQGKTRDEVIEESKPDAERELRREAVLAAIADAESIEVSDEDLVEALEHSAQHERMSPEKLLERLRKDGRDALVREDIRVRRAIDVVAESAKPIPMAQAEAREKLWTPEGESGQSGGGQLWTPGSD
jgi:trigger factor